MMAAPTDNLYVTGLPAGSDEGRIREVFSAYGGAVSSVRILPANATKTDVAAMVRMENADQAKYLIENVNGTAPNGMDAVLSIKPANSGGYGGKGKGGWNSWAPWSMEAQWMFMMQMKGKVGKGKGKGFGGGPGKGFGKGRGLSDFTADKKVWVGNLPEAVTFRELQAHFNTIGAAKFALVMKGKGAGTGGVAFATAEEATEAIAKLNGSELMGAQIVVDVWTKKEQEPAVPANA